jgi:crotonobetainyl-CoA:carnitine CoA-transferase CaiB-like acyl-CoA transferase
MLAGLYAQAVAGGGQSVATSLLGAGILVHSGVYLSDGALVAGPSLDAAQTGYGPGYRIYECGDGQWLALVVPSAAAWRRLAELAPVPPQYAPLRGGALDDVALAAERALEAALASGPAQEWVTRLRAAGSLAELIEAADRDAFRRKILDDPVNRELGRVVTYDTADWGRFEQIGPLVRYGPAAGAGPRLMLPRVGEHTVEVLAELGFSAAQTGQLLEAKVARQLPG